MISLPQEMLGMIIRFIANPLTTAPVNKFWKETTEKMYPALFTDYQKHANLEPFLARATEICQNDDPKLLVQTVYQLVHGEARFFSESKAKVKDNRSLGVVNDIRLEEIVHVVNQRKAQALNTLFSKIAEIYREAKDFLDSDEVKGLNEIELADATRAWMSKNARLFELAVGRFTIITLNSYFLHFLPPEIGVVKDLGGLYLANNQLQVLPKEISNMKNLIHLNLHNNLLQHFPKEIGDLTNLLALTISGNPLPNLDKELYILEKLTQLRILHVDKKQLEKLPKEIIHRPGLEVVTDVNRAITFHSTSCVLPCTIV